MRRYHPSSWTVFLVLLLFTAKHAATAQNIKPNDMNTKFDPDAANNTSTCTIPPPQKDSAFMPPEDSCQASTTALTLDDAAKLAHEYAPYIFFHPLENYTLDSVDATFDDPKNGKIWLYDQFSKGPLELFSDELTQTDLLRTIRQTNLSMHARMFFFSHEFDTPPNYLNGADFNELEGNMRTTKAPIYFNVIEHDENTWVFNYYFYYTFNGVANMVSLSSYKGDESYTSFTLSPFGLHEGDWEGMSVMVCKSTEVSQPLAVTYQQHGWQQTTDCTAGECTFFKDTHHPVGFSALNSHATYATSTQNMVYTTVEVPFFVNLQGVLIVDRTAYLAADGTYRAFAPDENNLIQMKNPEEIELGVTDESEYWQGFGGQWGNSTQPVILPELGICLNNEQTKTIECPDDGEDPIFGLVMQLMGVYPPTDQLISTAASQIGAALVPLFSETGSGPTGPMMKTQWRKWMDPKNSSLWSSVPSNTTAEGFCAKLQEIPDTGRLPVDSSDLDVDGNIIGATVLVLVLLVITLIGLWLGSKKRHMMIEFDENTGEVLKPGRYMWVQVHVAALIYTFWLIVVVVGAFLFGFSITDAMDLLERYVSGINWNAIGILLVVVGTIIMLIDLLLCILIWLPSQTLWKKINHMYHHYRGEKEEAELCRKDPCNLSFEKLHKCFLVSFSLLFISLMLTAIVVVVGVGVVAFSAAFSSICDSTVGSLDGICLDLNFFNIKEIKCGDDFKEFCNYWADSSRMVGMWGAILIAIGHFYLVGSAGASYHQQHSTMPMLDMLPRRKDYLQNIEDLKSKEQPIESFKSNQ